ncbi:MAG TPA: MBL fold metallo-hydrolase [Cycloclasticus sp.]|jgi:glyoxylase-like metal-dependent hydrolase (beta-lactamase superfamily II)|nr:MBL fold metallo-hydrolase [Cycloclasticus sp.]HIL92884.1 MBL fold metallo-hydrolase [Cycloclasticus sp.]
MFNIKTVLILMFLMASSASAATEYADSGVEMIPVQVSEHVWYVKGMSGAATENEGFVSNAGFIITSEGVVVYDALGSPSLGAQLLGEIGKITDQPIVKLILGHYHADHIYGAQVFKEEGAEVLAPVGVYKYIESTVGKERLEERRISLFPWVDDETYIIKPDRLVKQSESFTLGGVTFLMNIVGPAHSDGDMTLYIENDRVLFSGDLIFEGRVPYLGSSDTKFWLETLEKMEMQSLQGLIPGHGAAAKEPAKTVSLTRRYLAFIREKMGESVEDLQAFDEAYQQTDWSAFSDLPAFKEANRKNAYLVYLSLEAEALED